jgi:hypothetical protein
VDGRGRSGRALLVLLLAICSVVAVACSDDASTPRPNPVPPEGLEPGFAPPDFVNLPKPGSARPVDAPVESANAITQSFTVTGLDPQAVIDFYVRELPPDGWLPTHVENVGRATRRSVWTRGDQLLEVVASAVDGDTSAGQTQLDLVLRMDAAEQESATRPRGVHRAPG